MAQAQKIQKTTAANKVAQSRKDKSAKKASKWEFPLSRKNFIIAAIGVGVILIGFLLMATGISDAPSHTDAQWNNPMAVTIAPIVLVIGYCVIIPYAIMKFYGKKPETTEQQQS